MFDFVFLVLLLLFSSIIRHNVDGALNCAMGGLRSKLLFEWVSYVPTFIFMSTVKFLSMRFYVYYLEPKPMHRYWVQELGEENQASFSQRNEKGSGLF